MSSLAKRLLKVLLLGFLLGIVVLIFQYIFKIPSETISYWYPRIGIGVVLLTLAAVFLHQRRFFKQIQEISVEHRFGDRKVFLEKNLELLEKTKNKVHRALLSLNISAAYSDLGRFEEAKELLEGLDPQLLPGDNKYVRIVNLTYMYFRLGEREKAQELMDQHREKLISLQQKQTELGRSIAMNFIYEALLKGDKVKALSLIEEFKKTESSSTFEEDLENLEKLMKEN